jgi:PKD repeat protein
MNEDGVTDYTTGSPSHAFNSPGIKWVSLSGTAGGITYMRYKPIEISVSNKLPKLNDFNNSTSLPNGWKSFNPDNGRGLGICKCYWC